MDERTRRQLERGREHYGAGDYEKAARCLVPVLRAHHPFADVYQMMGVIYAHRGFTKRAQKMFEQALKLNPAYTEAAINLAVSYNEEGRYLEAREVHRRMLAARRKKGLAPGALEDGFMRGKLANKHAELADAYEQAGMLDDAIRERERALSLCASFLDIRAQLAASYRAAGDLEGAVREYARVKKENGKLIGPRLQLGMTYYVSGRPEEAAREWREVAALQPDNKVVKVYLAMVERGKEAERPRRARAQRG